MLEVLAASDIFSDRIASDPLRLIEAVTSGVAFLAAGMIIVTRGKVKGLTTGAGLWLAAAIGLSTGFGFWMMAAATTALALVVIKLVKLAEDKAHGG
jgi:putative Mg2+ transporter-C (MgtC) family protein